MEATSFLTTFGWRSILLVIVGVTILLAPIFVTGRFRSFFVAAYCVILSILVGLAWVRDRESRDDVSLIFCGKNRPDGNEGIWRTLRFISQRGDIGFLFQATIRVGPTEPARQFAPPFFAWVRSPPKVSKLEYKPRFFTPTTLAFNKWGFQALLYGEPERPVGISTLHWCSVVMPDWSLMLIFSLPIAGCFWFSWLPVMRIKYRRKHNLCIKCAYNLVGTPLAANGAKRCSECGHVEPAPMTGNVAKKVDSAIGRVVEV